MWKNWIIVMMLLVPVSALGAEHRLGITPTETYRLIKEQGGSILFIDVRDPMEIMFTGFTDIVDRNIPLAITDPFDFDEENGQVLGLVTLEDLLEEVVGEVEDEFDRLPRDIQHVSPGIWVVGGGVTVSQVAAKLETELTDPEGNLSQWLEIRLGQSPKAGLTYAEAGFEFTVRRIRRRHVFDVTIKRQELSSAAQLPAAG